MVNHWWIRPSWVTAGSSSIMFLLLPKRMGRVAICRFLSSSVAYCILKQGIESCSNWVLQIHVDGKVISRHGSKSPMFQAHGFFPPWPFLPTSDRGSARAAVGHTLAWPRPDAILIAVPNETVHVWDPRIFKIFRCRDGFSQQKINLEANWFLGPWKSS